MQPGLSPESSAAQVGARRAYVTHGSLSGLVFPEGTGVFSHDDDGLLSVLLHPVAKCPENLYLKIPQ